MNWRKHQARQNARYFQSYGVIFCCNLKTLGLILYFMNALTLALKHVLLFILVIVIKKSLCLLMLSHSIIQGLGVVCLERIVNLITPKESIQPSKF